MDSILSDCGRSDLACLGFDRSLHQFRFDLALPLRFAMQPVAKGNERRIVGAAGTIFQIPGFLFCGDDRERRDQPAGCQRVGDIERLRRRYPDVAMMMGVGNLTELTDADSAGLNVLLLGFCQELGIRSVLTTQVINWCRSCVRELDLARRLVRHAVVNRVHDENGKVLRLHGIYHDVTAHRLAEGKLQSQRRKYQQLFDNSDVCLWLVDCSAIFAASNKAATF